jgi:glycosyltransferase involved in cell wall biosynthesis
MKFSVVIAVFNKEKYIGRTLQSVLDQTFTDFEIVVVNDGSTDNSEAVIQRFSDPRIRYYTQQNQGAGAARNSAISKATAPWIALLDADDRWYPDYLAEIDRLTNSYPGQAVLATGIAIEKSGTTILPTYSISNLKKEEVRIVDFFESSYIHSLLTSSSTVLHRKVFEQVGMYNPTIKSGQDTDLWVRVGLQYKVVFFNKVLAVYEYATQSLFKSTKNISEKASFEGYEAMEQQRPEVKKFLDLNRFSLALLAKMQSDTEAFRKNSSKISLKNLNNKQRFLLKAPAGIVRSLYRLKQYFERNGIYLSAFK